MNAFTLARALVALLAITAAQALADPAVAEDADAIPEDRASADQAVDAKDEEQGEEQDAKEEAAEAEETQPVHALEERVTVIGSADKVKDVPGSAHYIDAEELAKHRDSDIHRVLRRVPGVYVQDEEGYGLRPNIGMRGTGVERSQKITLMEDGTLIAPAPYSAPPAYYFPSVARMAAVEVSKGASSIEHGPLTNGGVLNLISRRIPFEFAAGAELAAGSDDQATVHLHAGDSAERLGWMVETYREQTDGFKRLDGGGDTGFEIDDLLGKLQLHSRSGAALYQSLELKLGATEQQGRETYLGLTPQDFTATPYRRYAASAEDSIVTDHEQVQLRYFAAPSARVDLTATVYHNDFSRNWRKLERVGGASVGAVLANPDAFPAELTGILRGEVDSEPDALAIRNNRRDYYSRGAQAVLGRRLRRGATQHELELGLRYHEDGEDRFQEEDGFQMLAGSLLQTSSGAPGSQANRISGAEAWALFVRDRIDRGRWTFSPGLRLESIDFVRLDYAATDPARTAGPVDSRRNGVSTVIPGLGVAYRPRPEWSLHGGVYRGFAPPGPGQDDRVDPEESLNHELGLHFDKDRLHLQLTAFYNDYDNLLGTDTTASGGPGTGDFYNGGEVRVAGLELSFGDDPALGRDRRRTLPYRLAYTYSTAEFRSSFLTAFEDWAPEVHSGDELPYLPEHQLFAEIGWRNDRWAAYLSGSYVGTMRTKAGQGRIVEAERIGDHLVFDLSAERTLGSRYRAFARVRNLTDEVYLAARRPAGLRPGLPRTMLVGFGIDF